MLITGTVQGQPPFTVATTPIVRRAVQPPSVGIGSIGLGAEGGFDWNAFVKSVTTPAFDLVKTIVAPPTMTIRNADGSTTTIRTPQTVQTGPGPTTAQSIGQAVSNIGIGGISPTTLLIGGGLFLAVMMMSQDRR